MLLIIILVPPLLPILLPLALLLLTILYLKLCALSTQHQRLGSARCEHAHASIHRKGLHWAHPDTSTASEVHRIQLSLCEWYCTFPSKKMRYIIRYFFFFLLIFILYIDWFIFVRRLACDKCVFSGDEATSHYTRRIMYKIIIRWKKGIY